MQIIADQEPTCRGTYAGAVGYFGFSGNLDSCIAIRTRPAQGRQGLPASRRRPSLPTRPPLGEYQESINKAKAGLKALAMAKLF